MKKFIALLTLLFIASGCASKPIIVKDCNKVEGDAGQQVCWKI